MLKIEFETTNAALRDYDSGDINTYEIARILKYISDAIESGRSSGKAIDYNGNCVGSWSLD